MNGDDLCRYLRAKVTGAPHNDKQALHAMRDDATAVFWCLLTMSTCGPDDGLVHVRRCGAGRSCCVPDATRDDVA